LLFARASVDFPKAKICHDCQECKGQECKGQECKGQECKGAGKVRWMGRKNRLGSTDFTHVPRPAGTGHIGSFRVKRCREGFETLKPTLKHTSSTSRRGRNFAGATDLQIICYNEQMHTQRGQTGWSSAGTRGAAAARGTRVY
jgi:hypothetical protein